MNHFDLIVLTLLENVLNIISNLKKGYKYRILLVPIIFSQLLEYVR